MTIKVMEMVRSFSYNGVSLPDPGKNLTPEQVRDVFSATYPELTTAAIEGPEMKGAKLVFSFRKAVGTKGARGYEFGLRKHDDGLTYVRLSPANPTRAALKEAVKKIGRLVDRWLFSMVGDASLSSGNLHQLKHWEK